MTQTKAELLQTRHQGDIRLGDADSTNYVGFKAPATVGSNLVWTLPATDGSANQFLQTNASGVLSWGTADTSASMPLTGGAFTGDVTFTGASANIVFDKSDNALEFADNARAFFGASSDLQIYHNNHNYITSTNGDLILQSPAGNWFYVKTDAGNDNSIIAKNNGAVELYHNNVKKFATSAAGISITGAATISTDLTVTGDLTVSGTTTTINTQTLDVEDKNVVIGKVSSPSDTTADGGGWTLKGATDKTFNWVNATDAWTSSEHIHLLDNRKLYLGGASGTTDGCEIYHNGSDTLIHDTGTGNLAIQSNGAEIQLSKGGSFEHMVRAIVDGAVELYHDNSKKLETTAGGINVTGAINVNGSALSTAPQITATASGAITAGNPVVVNTNGSVSKIGLSFTALGTPTYDTENISANMPTAYSPIPLYSASADTYAFLYRDGDYSKIVCGQLNSSGEWSVGSPSGNISADSDYSQHASMAIVPASEVSGASNDVLVVVYRDYPGNNDGWMRLGTVNSNKTISLNSGHNDITGSDMFRSYMRAMGNGKVILGYSNGSEVKVIALDITGSNAFSSGSESTALDGGCGNANPVYISEPDSNGKAIIMAINNSSKLVAQSISVSGTTITLGTVVELTSYAIGSLRDPKIAYNEDNDNFLAVFTNNALQCVAMTISGTTITKSSVTPIQLSGSNIETRGIGVVYDSRLKHFWAHVSRDGNSNDPTNYYFPVTATGSSTPTIGTAKEHDFGTNLIDGLNSIYLQADNTVASVGRNTSSSNDIYLTAAVFSSSASNLTAENFIGFANATASDTAQATIDVSGATNSSQSSLTAGQKYYVQPAGTIGLTPGSPSVFAGTAISATKILVNDQQTVPTALGEVDEWGQFTGDGNSSYGPWTNNTWGDESHSRQLGELTRYSGSGMPKGSGVVPTNGIFTFPSTGIYEISSTFYFQRYDGNGYFQATLQLSTNGGSSWISGIDSTGLDMGEIYIHNTYGNRGTIHPSAIVNITDTTNYKVRVNINAGGNNMYVRPGSKIRFKKIG